jgi:TonB family protein
MQAPLVTLLAAGTLLASPASAQSSISPLRSISKLFTGPPQFVSLRLPAQDTTVYTAADGVTLPKVVKPVGMRIPPERMKAEVHGSNIVEVVVLPDGTVGDVKLIQSFDPIPGFHLDAIGAARQCVFQPGTKDGRPVAVRVRIVFALACSAQGNATGCGLRVDVE